MKFINGNIFNTNHQTIVNTINLCGYMGAGMAFECCMRYPEMYTEYIRKYEYNEIR